MRRSKKFIIIMATVATVLALTLSGVAFAEEESGSNNQPVPRQEVLLERVCEIYEDNTGVALDSEELQNAFAQAGDGMRDEAMEARLQNLIEQGKITQEEAKQYLEWWESKPDTESFGPFRLMFQKQFRHNLGLQGPMGHNCPWGGPLNSP